MYLQLVHLPLRSELFVVLVDDVLRSLFTFQDKPCLCILPLLAQLCEEVEELLDNARVKGIIVVDVGVDSLPYRFVV